MKYCIIGGLGFVGNELLRLLISEGHDVTVIDNEHRIAPEITDILSAVKRYRIDIRDFDSLNEAINTIEPDHIVHLAAIHYIPECNQDPTFAFDVNVTGTVNVLRSVEACQPKSVVVVSSGAVYADSAESLDESESRIEPVDVYGITKKTCEDLCELFAKQNSDIRFSIARLFNVYGPRETNAHIIPEIISQLKSSNILSLGNLKPRRDMIFTKDVARAFYELARRKRGENCETVNVCTGEDASMQEIIDMIGQITGRAIEVKTDPSRFRKSDKLVQKGSPEKLFELTGFKPSTSLIQGLEQLVAFEGMTSDE